MENKFTEINPAEIKEGLLLNEEQINYLFTNIKDSIALLTRLEEALSAEGQLSQGSIFTKKLIDDLKHCVTILRKENDL